MHDINLTLGFMMKQKNGNEKKQQTESLTTVITRKCLHFFVKGILSLRERPPFTIQNTVFRNAKGILSRPDLYANKTHFHVLKCSMRRNTLII